MFSYISLPDLFSVSEWGRPPNRVLGHVSGKGREGRKGSVDSTFLNEFDYLAVCSKANSSLLPRL